MDQRSLIIGTGIHYGMGKGPVCELDSAEETGRRKTRERRGEKAVGRIGGGDKTAKYLNRRFGEVLVVVGCTCLAKTSGPLGNY
jgi:hypothetical protein